MQRITGKPGGAWAGEGPWAGWGAQTAGTGAGARCGQLGQRGALPALLVHQAFCVDTPGHIHLGTVLSKINDPSGGRRQGLVVGGVTVATGGRGGRGVTKSSRVKPRWQHRSL